MTNLPSSSSQISYGPQSAVAGPGGTATVNIIPPPPPPPIPLIALPRAEHFTGRERELAQLLQALQPNKVVTLCGPGGIGKTALAVEAIRALIPNNTPPDIFPDGIVYYSFYNEPRLTRTLEEIIFAFKESYKGNLLSAAQRVLSNRQALLFLDGAERADDLKKVLDVRGRCGVLITTRNRKDIFGKRLDISSLPIDKAVKLLQAWAEEQASDEAFARQICELVGGLPLAVCLVGGYLTQTGEYADEYLEWLEKTPLEALQESVPILLAKSLTKVSISAQQALAVVGMLAFAPFNYKVVAAVLDIEDYQARQLLGELVNYSLLVRRKDRRYEVSHPLVHTYARERLRVSEIESETKAIEERFIKYFFDMAQEAASEQASFTAIDQSHPHILKALEKVKEGYAEGGNEARKLMIDFVDTLEKYWQTHNQYEVQLIWLKEASETAKYLKKPCLQAKFAYARARILYLQGKLEQAKEDCRYGLSGVHETEQSEAVAEGYNLLGSIHGRSGEYKAAFTSLQKSADIWQEVGNEFKMARVLDNLATAYFNQGNISKASEIDEGNLRYWKRVADEGQLAVTLNNSGFLRYTLGECKTMAGLLKEAASDYQEAIKYHHQAAEISQRLSVQKELALANMNSAWPHIALKEWDQAGSHLSNSLEIQEKHNITISEAETNRALAEVAIGQGNFKKALAYAKTALAKAEGEDKAEEGSANRVLGKAYRLSGKLDKARRHLNTSLTQLQAIDNPFETALTWREVALLYQEQERKQEAQKVQAEVQAILVKMGIIEPEEGESND